MLKYTYTLYTELQKSKPLLQSPNPIFIPESKFQSASINNYDKNADEKAFDTQWLISKYRNQMLKLRKARNQAESFSNGVNEVLWDLGGNKQNHECIHKNTPKTRASVYSRGKTNKQNCCRSISTTHHKSRSFSLNPEEQQIKCLEFQRNLNSHIITNLNNKINRHNHTNSKIEVSINKNEQNYINNLDSIQNRIELALRNKGK